jgi:hypothetical protein
MIATLVGFFIQRRFWRNFAICGAIFSTPMLIVASLQLIYPPKGMTQIPPIALLVIPLYEYAGALVIFGAVRGFLFIMGKAYWKQPPPVRAARS